MAITVTYNNLAALGSNFGIADYLSYYESTFSQTNHYDNGGFSNDIATGVTVNGVNYGSTYSDKQYTSSTSSAGQTSAFIAEAAATGTGQLTYSLFNSPTHTLFGPLDVIKFGATLTKPSTLWQLGTTYVTLSGLDAPLNGGLDASGNVIPWATGNNDVHNVIYPLLSGSASGVRNAFNTHGVDIVGTAGNDEFNGYSAADIFRTAGGTDTVISFASNDKIDIAGMGFASAADAVAAADNSSGDTVISNGSHSVTLVGYVGSFTTANIV